MTGRQPQLPADLAELISAYAIGGVDDREARFAEQHIDNDPACRAAYEDALETLATLAVAETTSQPSPVLRDRIVTAARAELPAPQPTRPRLVDRLRGAFTPARGLALAGIAVALVALGVAVDSQRELDRRSAIDQIATDPAATVTNLGSLGRVVRSSRGTLLVARFDAPANGRTYQLWAIANGGAPVSLGTVGGGTRTLVLPRRANDAGTIAVSVEPVGGSPQPTTTPIAAATF